jgi:pseudaminic acid cytidylyltransferase
MPINIAVIPARGGSKRIPGKNIKTFCGKPIIAYSIEAAVRSGVIDRVLVSTDDPQIAEVARAHGAETPFVRPANLSDDFTPTVPVISHAIEWVGTNWAPVRKACCLYATAPFIRDEDIRDAYARHEREAVGGYVFTATSFGFPIQRAFAVDDNGFCRMFHPQLYNARSQDLEPAYQDAGQFYWGAAESFCSGKHFFSDDSKPHVLPRHRVQDIDTLEDWVRAEAMWRVMHLMQAEHPDGAGAGDRPARA